MTRTATMLVLLLAGAAAATSSPAEVDDQAIASASAAASRKTQWAPTSPSPLTENASSSEAATARTASGISSVGRENAVGSRIWLSLDPVGSSGRLRTPNALGPWAYANLNPLSFTDPNGEAGVRTELNFQEGQFWAAYENRNLAGWKRGVAAGFGATTWALERTWGVFDTLSFGAIENLDTIHDNPSQYTNGAGEWNDAYYRGVGAEVGKFAVKATVARFAGNASIARFGVARTAATVGVGAGLSMLGQVAEQGSEKDFSQVKYGDALFNGLAFSAVPVGLGALPTMSRGWKLAVGAASLYFAGTALGEGGAALSGGIEGGDPWKLAYGGTSILFGLAGAKASYSSFLGGLPFEKMPSWLFADVEAAGTAGMFGAPPLRLNFRVAQYRQTMLELGQLRAELGLPPAGSAEDEFTLTKLLIGGRKFYGMEGGVPIQDRAAFVALMREAAIAKGGSQPLAQFARHAEGDSFYQAFMQGVNGRSASLFSDRPVCGFCRSSLANARHILGIEDLTVFDANSPAGRPYPP